MAELCRFYGWSLAEVEQLTPVQFQVFRAAAHRWSALGASTEGGD